MRPSILLALPLLAAPAVPAAAQEPVGPTALVHAQDRDARLARDRHLSFGGRTAERARDALDVDREEDSLARPGTLMALGCSGELGDVARLEAYAAGDRLRDRRAAILALGELGPVGRGPLRRIAHGDVSGVEESVVLAWIVSDPDAAAEEVNAWADDPEAPLHEAALLFREYAAGGPPPAGARAVDVRLELRWYAARHFGMVDQRRWKDLLLEELLGNEAFLDRVVLGASAARDEPSVRDHLFEILRGEHRPSVLPAAVRALPEELGVALDAGLWAPADLGEWKILLREIEDRRLEKPARRLLERAMEIEELEPLAGIQLLRAGGDLPKAWLSHEFHAAPIERRCLALEALGDRNDPDRIDDLLQYLDPGHPIAIQSSALVALARLQHRTSIDGILMVLKGGKTVERRDVLLSIARQLHDTRLARAVAEALEIDDLDPEVRFRLEVARGVNGRLRDRTRLRQWLREGHPHELRRDAVRAIAIKPGREDLAILRELFPVEDDLDVNVELALGLLQERQKEVNVILRTALWEGDWNRSVLAGGLLAHAVSIHGLMEEVDHPPPGAGEGDLRRVGFAIGEWGGLTAVGKLARRHNESDPALQGALLGALSTQTQ